MSLITSIDTIKLPEIRDDLNITQGPKAQNGSPTWTIYDPIANQYYRIGWEAYEIISLFSFADSPQKIVDHVNSKLPLEISVEEVKDVIKFLHDNQLLRVTSQGHIEQLQKRQEKENKSLIKTLLHSYIFIKIKLLDPNDFLQATLPIVRLLYSRLFFMFAVCVFILCAYLTSRRADEFLNTFQDFLSWEGFALYIFVIAIVKIFHEFGHAYAAKRCGVDVTDLGIAFIVLYPILYTDTTDSWKMQDPKKRWDIGIAGIGAEFYLAVICLFLWNILPDGTPRSLAFVISSASFATSLLVNLNPLMKLDGYYLFSDLIGIENLQPRSFELARRKMRKILWGWPYVSPESTLHPKKESFLIKFAYATWVYRFFLFLGIAILVYNVFPKPFGLIMMIIELTFFIAFPIIKELSVWIKGASPMKATFNAIITLSIIALAIAAFIVPWHNTMSLPAIIYNEQYQNIIAPYAGKIEKIDIKIGQNVSAGDELIKLSSGTLKNDIRRTAIDIRNAEMQLEAMSRDRTLIKERAVLLREKYKLMQENENARNLLKDLSIKSDINGIITQITKELHQGRWISKGDPLLTITAEPSTKNITIHAFATEKQIPFIQNEKYGYFYDDNNALSKIKIKLIDISEISTTNLPWKELSSRYGGPITVDTEHEDENISHEPLYRLTLQVQNQEDIENLQNTIRGHVTIKIKERNFSSEFIRSTVALFNREFTL